MPTKFDAHGLTGAALQNDRFLAAGTGDFGPTLGLPLGLTDLDAAATQAAAATGFTIEIFGALIIVVFIVPAFVDGLIFVLVVIPAFVVVVLVVPGLAGEVGAVVVVVIVILVAFALGLCSRKSCKLQQGFGIHVVETVHD